MEPLKLYDLELSGNCYKARLLLNMLEVDYERIPVGFMGGEHKSSVMLEKNPFGELPVLEFGDRVLRDSQAILVFLVNRYGDDRWLPIEPEANAEVMQWLMVAENEIARGPNDARLHDLFGYDLDVEAARKRADDILRILEAHLLKQPWLCVGHPTIADIACFPYVALSHEGGVDLTPYSAVGAWIERIKQLPKFISMPGL